MQLFRRYKTVLLIGILVIIAFVVYSILFGNTTDEVLVSETQQERSEIESELIALLLQLREVELDPSLFGDPVFQSLRDFSTELVPEPVGRQNPFAPLGAAAPAAEEEEEE